MRHRKLGLDYLRAAAIVMVVVCHVCVFFKIARPAMFPLGSAGVELFFVLSGYLVGGIFLRQISRNDLTPALVGNFWMRRWLRTLPIYLLFIPIYYYVQGTMLKEDLWKYLLFLNNLAWPMPAGFNISWSLAIEEWFYLLMPLFTLGLAYVLRDKYRAFFVTVGLMFLGPLVLRLATGTGMEWDSELRKVVVFRLDAIMTGVIVAIIERYRPAWFARMCSPLGVGAAVVVAGSAYAYLHWRYMGATTSRFDAQLLDILLFSWMDIGFAMLLPIASVVRGVRGLDWVIVRISIWSYAMYLAHRPALFLLGTKWTMFDLDPSIAGPIAATTITLAASAFLHYAFEVPVLRLRDRWFPDRRGPVESPDLPRDPEPAVDALPASGWRGGTGNRPSPD